MMTLQHAAPSPIQTASAVPSESVVGGSGEPEVIGRAPIDTSLGATSPLVTLPPRYADRITCIDDHHGSPTRENYGFNRSPAPETDTSGLG